MGRIVGAAKTEGQACIPFSAPESATECVKFATSPARKENALSPGDLSIRIFDAHVRLYVVFFPADKFKVVWPFWMNAGVGVSSRLAEDCIKHVELLHEVKDTDLAPKLEESTAHGVLQERIAGLLERVRISSPILQSGSEEVVGYLFPC
jgi:cystathionine gamma-synthase